MKNALLLAAAVAATAAGSARAEPILVLAASAAGQRLYTVDSATPGVPTGASLPITGLTAGDVLVGVDQRPTDFALVVLGYNATAGTGRVYRIDPITGTATQINGGGGGPGVALTFGNNVASFGFDFNPVPVGSALRIVSTEMSNGTTTPPNNNFRITNGGEGTFNIDGDLNPGAPRIVAAGYTNSSPGAVGTSTTLYGIDAALNQLFIQNPPNNGTLTTPVNLGFDPTDSTSFDISGFTNQAFATVGSTLVNFNLTTGAVIGTPATIGGLLAGESVLAITTVPEPGSLALCGLAAAGLLGYARRRKQAAAATVSPEGAR